jgi:hypothetical protein
VYGAHLGSNEKTYFQEVYAGNRFSIYKRYKGELEYVSSNYIQSELRQFELTREYYYTDAESKTIKKIKPNLTSLVKEFKDVKDLSSVVTNDDITINPDNAFAAAFKFLNN